MNSAKEKPGFSGPSLFWIAFGVDSVCDSQVDKKNQSGEEQTCGYVTEEVGSVLNAEECNKEGIGKWEEK